MKNILVLVFLLIGLLVGWLGLFGLFFKTLIAEFQVDGQGFYPSVLSME